MSLCKLPFLVLSSISFYSALDLPSPAGPEDTIMVASTQERAWRYAGLPCNLFLKSTTWLATMAESAVILGALPGIPGSSSPTAAILKALGPGEASKLTAPFFLGTLLIMTGGFIRVNCYRELGQFFKFELCIRKEHRLITTGPYAVVRHPSYTGLLMCIVGSSIVYGSPGSWLRDSGVLRAGWVRAVLGSWCLIMGASVLTLIRRSTDEDRFLSERFRNEWEGWARRVRYKLVPFVY